MMFCSVVLCAPLAWTQTFEINGQQTQPSATSPNGSQPGAKKSAAATGSTGDNGIGWGSSIEVGRLARAAEDALRRGNPGQAADYAERAVKAAPGDNKLWFLLGYTARMAGRYQQSLDAYQHGLQNSPGNPDGMSGLAQTYAAMGRIDQALQLLQQVIRANPHRTNDLLVAGQLYMKTGNTQQAIDLLQRAEAQEPNPHIELMLGMGYLKLKQPQKAKEMLDLARKHAPGNVEIYQAAATFYREQHDYQAAIDMLKRAPRMTPSVLGDLGYSYELAGDKQAAADAYSKAANADPKNVGYQLSAAQSAIARGRPGEEQDLYKPGGSDKSQ